MVMDNATEQKAGEYMRKSRYEDFHIQTTEPFTPWMNWDELGVQESKKGVAWKTINKQSPKVLWEDYAELKAMTQSNTSHDIYGLKVKLPETMVTGKKWDIS